MAIGNNNLPGANYVINIPLSRYLLMRGLAKQRNISFAVPANSTYTQNNNALAPDNGDKAILIKTLQFDGVQSGLVAYEFVIDGSQIAGYAIQGTEDEVELVNVGPTTYTINNTQTTSIVVNIDYLSIPASSMSIDILQALYGIGSGGRYPTLGA